MTTVTAVKSEAQNAPVVDALRHALADSYALYFKTHSYHWNVRGMYFHALHTLFEQQYTEMWQALDEIAERIRALGANAPLTSSDMMKGATVAGDSSVPAAEDMVSNLITGHKALLTTLTSALEVAQEAGDEVSADLILTRMEVHEKTLWMLESLKG